MLEIGAVVDARRQHRDSRRTAAHRRRTGRQRFQEVDRIVADLAHRYFREELRKHLEHRFAILEHVGHPRRSAGIILQHIEFVGAGADDIDAADMGIDAARRIHAHHHRQEGIVARDQRGRHPAGTQNLLPVIDIVEKGVERAHPLLDPARQAPPFARRDDPRHDVERDQPLVGVGLAIDVEGNACGAKKGFGLLRLALDALGILGIEPFAIFAIGRPGPAIPGYHLVEEGNAPTLSTQQPRQPRTINAAPCSDLLRRPAATRPPSLWERC